MQDRHVTERLAQFAAHEGIDRGFLADAPIRPLTLEGAAGIAVMVRLTSYRALPLSCIAGIDLAIDGQPVDLSRARLEIGGVFHPLANLGALSHVWWFVLDIATLFVPLPAPPVQGAHQLEGTLRTVEPYITAGRFTFYNTSIKQISLEEALA